MATLLKLSDEATARRSRPLERIFRGYRFRVCTDAPSVARALDVRRRVYQGDCGYTVPVPDQYDARSWLLVAEEVATGEAVGTMRVTPRFGGPLEAEEYFELPPALRVPGTVEITRFAILPAYRNRTRILPVVSAGLVKLAILFLQQIGARSLVVCSTPERVWTYTWLNMKSTGRTARYAKLANLEHELLSCDLHEAIVESGHRFKESFLDLRHPEIVLPATIPAAASILAELTRVGAEPRRVAEGGRR